MTGCAVCTGDASEVAAVATGPGDARFTAAGYGRYVATLRTAGAYVVTATFGGKLAAGWPKALDIVPASGGPVRCAVKGDALNGVTCGQPVTLTLSTADQFGNPRCAALVTATVCRISMG